jgi:hypothetical protein
MGIRSRVQDALLLYENGHYEGAFLNVLVAVAATARRECSDEKMSDRDCFEKFLDRKWRGVISVEFRGECHPISHIFYKWFRCELVHEGGLPIDVEFIDSDKLSVRAGGTPEYVLKVSRGWFHWLIQAVIESPCNRDDFLEMMQK